MFVHQLRVIGILLCITVLTHQMVTPTKQAGTAKKEPHPIDSPLSMPMDSYLNAQSAYSSTAAQMRRPFHYNHIQPLNHPDYNSKIYLFDVTLERPTASVDPTYEVLSSIYTIFQSMPINNLLPEDAFKVVGKPHVILIVKGKPHSQDIASSVERIVRSLERLGTKVDVTLLYSLEAFVERTASKLMPLAALVDRTRAPIPDLGYTNLYMCRLTYTGSDMDKLTYVSQTLNVTLEMLAMRAAGKFDFKGHRIAGSQPFEFYIHQGPAGNEIGAIQSIPLLHAGNVNMHTEEVQPLGHVLDVMTNTQAINIVKV